LHSGDGKTRLRGALALRGVINGSGPDGGAQVFNG
jgi:hypothetical protein